MCCHVHLSCNDVDQTAVTRRELDVCRANAGSGLGHAMLGFMFCVYLPEAPAGGGEDSGKNENAEAGNDNCGDGGDDDKAYRFRDVARAHGCFLRAAELGHAAGWAGLAGLAGLTGRARRAWRTRRP